MRFMMIVKATPDSEAGTMPKQELFEAMGKYNEELVKAGVLLAAEGLHPTSKGARVEFQGDKRTVVEGPFTEPGLIAGFWLIQANSLEEAIQWAKRSPNPHPGRDTHIEIRRVFDAEDFGDALTPELKQQEERLRSQSAERAKQAHAN
jgi:hypothetical protein